MTRNPQAVLPRPERASGYRIDCLRAGLCVHARSLATVLTVDGEIDATNSDRIAANIRRFVVLRSPLVIDLAKLDFLAVEGFRALLAVERHCRQAGVPMSVVAGTALRAYLRLPEGATLPVASSVSEALHQIAAHAGPVAAGPVRQLGG